MSHKEYLLVDQLRLAKLFLFIDILPVAGAFTSPQKKLLM